MDSELHISAFSFILSLNTFLEHLACASHRARILDTYKLNEEVCLSVFYVRIVSKPCLGQYSIYIESGLPEGSLVPTQTVKPLSLGGQGWRGNQGISDL